MCRGVVLCCLMLCYVMLWDAGVAPTATKVMPPFMHGVKAAELHPGPPRSQSTASPGDQVQHVGYRRKQKDNQCFGQREIYKKMQKRHQDALGSLSLGLCVCVCVCLCVCVFVWLSPHPIIADNHCCCCCTLFTGKKSCGRRQPCVRSDGYRQVQRAPLPPP